MLSRRGLSFPRVLLGVLLGLSVWAPCVAADQLESVTPLNPFAFETITVSSTALGFTAATYAPATGGSAQRALMTCETDQIRYRYDGGTPTSSVGHLLSAGTSLTITSRNAVNNFRMIRVTSNATCQVTYER